jgi:acyl-CoA synthetase (AMP-forming)/AMP-acid ligase II
VVGELIYYGENVSPGYADEPLDLVSGDHNGGRLATGDMAKRDAQGLYTIVGRKKRFLKVFGNRVGLDELEQLVKNHFPQLECAAGGEDDHIRIWLTESASAAAVKECCNRRQTASLPALTVIVTPEIPKTRQEKPCTRNWTHSWIILPTG